MSSYLNISLKHKDQDIKLAPCILYLTTTPARELADNVDIRSSIELGEDGEMHSQYNELDLDLLHDIQNYYKHEIEYCKKIINDDKNEIKEKTNLLLNAKSEMVFDKIQEQIDDLKSNIHWTEGELESVEDYFRKFTYLEIILEDNKDFVLMYYYD